MRSDSHFIYVTRPEAACPQSLGFRVESDVNEKPKGGET